MVRVVSTFQLVPFHAGSLVLGGLGFTFDRELRLLDALLDAMPGPRHCHDGVKGEQVR